MCVVTVCVCVEGGGGMVRNGERRKEERGRRGNKGLGGNDSSHN